MAVSALSLSFVNRAYVFSKTNPVPHIFSSLIFITESYKTGNITITRFYFIFQVPEKKEKKKKKQSEIEVKIIIKM